MKNLKKWMKAKKITETLEFDKLYRQPIDLMLYTIPRLLTNDNKEYHKLQDSITLIDEVKQRSMQVLIVKMTLVDDTTFVICHSLDSWQIAVSSPKDIEANFLGLFDPDMQILGTSCEDLPNRYIWDPYTKNKRQFSLKLPPNDHFLFMFFWIFAYTVLGKNMVELNPSPSRYRKHKIILV